MIPLGQSETAQRHAGETDAEFFQRRARKVLSCFSVGENSERAAEVIYGSVKPGSPFAGMSTLTLTSKWKTTWASARVLPLFAQLQGCTVR